MLGSQPLDSASDAALWAALLDPTDGGGIKPSTDADDLASLLPELAADADDTAVSTATGSEPDAEPMTDASDASWAALQTLCGLEEDDDGAPGSPMTWTEPSPPAALQQQVASPNAGTMDVRRMKNREFMRRARERQREDFKRMKATVARLERQYARLSARAAGEAGEAPGLEDALVALPTAGGLDRQREQLQQRFAAILPLVKRLRAENLYLKAGLQERANWKQDLHRILDSMVDPASDLRAEFQAARAASSPSPRTSPSPQAPRSLVTASRPVTVNFDVMELREAQALFHFSPLDEAAVARVIVDNAVETQRIRSSLTATTMNQDAEGVRRHDVLGWDVVQRVRGTFMEYIQTKTFRDLDVAEAGHHMWMNDMQTDSFRRVVTELRRIEVLQRVSANAYILGRDIKPFDGDTVFRSVFMRFRTQVSREIPNGALPPLRATGFAIGSHSLNRDWSNLRSLPPFVPYRPGDGSPRPAGLHDGEPLEWADFVYSTEFLTVEDPWTGDRFNQIQWIGRSDFKSHAEALRNAPDALTACLRTEMLLFRPALQLNAITDGT